MESNPGHYLGTEIDGKWWKRFTRDGMSLRGKGRYWFEGNNLRFLRYLTRSPITVPMGLVKAVEVGTWHAGRWAMGIPIIKLVWLHEGQTLSSGFILGKKPSEVETIVQDLKRRISEARAQ